MKRRYIGDSMRQGAVFAVLFLGCVFAGVAEGALNDRLARFSTPGPDRYADGLVVRDGECYALVWSPAGQVFSGFNADGTPVSANDRVVLAGELAKGGRCPDAVFQIAASEYEALKDGEWAVCLVDTRRADGTPTGVQDGKPMRVNRWGVVADGVAIEPASASGIALPASSGSRARLASASTSGARASRLSALPASLKPPKITALDVSEGAARLTIKDTVPYLTYTVSSAATPAPGGFARDKYADRRDGAADAKAEIVLETDAPGATRFFKVTRAE